MAMGYEPEDLPWEVPLIELGLDSMMAVRIKNRVEYDFDLPPIQLQAVRDANLYDVEKLIEYAIEHRDEVQELHEHQKIQTADEIAKEQAALVTGAAPASVTAPTPDPQVEPETQAKAPADIPNSDVPIPPPPTDPSGPSAAHRAAQPGGRRAGAQPAGRRRGARFGHTAARCRRAGHVRHVGDRHRQVPGRHLQRRCRSWTTTRPPRWRSGCPSAPRGRSPPRTSRPPRPSRNWPTTVREYLEAGQIDGFVRIIRARPEGSTKPPVFVFHAAGGSTVVYEPLLNRLPPDTPMYGFERVEGTIEERAAQYVPKLRELQGDGPFILVGWSLGGVLAYACAIGLKQQGCDVPFVGLIDAVRAGEEIPQTKKETRKRWERYARFAERTFNVEIPEIPYGQLEELDDEGQVRFVLEAVSQSGVQIPGGIIEHQRTSYLDNRAIDTVQVQPYDGHVTLYMADRYHDDAIMFEPRYATRQPDGGWGDYVSDLEIVPIGGEHIQAIDEPIIAKVGTHMSQALNKIEAEEKEA